MGKNGSILEEKSQRGSKMRIEETNNTVLMPNLVNLNEMSMDNLHKQSSPHSTLGKDKIFMAQNKKDFKEYLYHKNRFDELN